LHGKNETMKKPFKESVMWMTGESRLSYVHLFEPAKDPGGRMVRSTSILIPKSDATSVQELFKSVQDVLAMAVNGGYFKQEEVASLHNPIYDGDEHVKIGKRGPEYEGYFYLNAKSTRPIAISKQIAVPGGHDVVQIIDPDELYSGCWARCALSFFAFDNVTRGIAVGINGVMKVRDDDRLDGVPSAANLFSQFKTAEGGETPEPVAAAPAAPPVPPPAPAAPATPAAAPSGAPANPFANLT